MAQRTMFSTRPCAERTPLRLRESRERHGCRSPFSCNNRLCRLSLPRILIGGCGPKLQPGLRLREPLFYTT